eukprot:1301463-Rhodomonas_salina.1
MRAILTWDTRAHEIRARDQSTLPKHVTRARDQHTRAGHGTAVRRFRPGLGVDSKQPQTGSESRAISAGTGMHCLAS